MKHFSPSVAFRWLVWMACLLPFATASAQNETEPNNTFETAGFVGFTQKATGTVCPQGDVDFIKTVMPRDGAMRATISVKNNGTGTGLCHFSAFDQRKGNGNLFNITPAYYTGAGQTTEQSADIFCRSKGDTIYFRVTQEMQCYGYEIAFEMLGTDSPNDTEPNATFEQATPFSMDSTVSGHIGYFSKDGRADDADFYKTVLPTDGKYRMYIRTTNTGSGTGLLHFSGFDQRKSNGNIFNTTPAYYTGNGVSTTDSIDLFCRSAGDTLYFRVTRDFQCFAYSISYKLVGEPSDNDPEPNNSFDQAHPFNLGDTIKGHIGYVAANAVTDAVDFFKTVLPTDGKYRMYMYATNTGNNTGLLHVKGYDQRRDNGNIFSSTPAYYTAPGVQSVDSVDLFCRSAGDTIYFRVSHDFQCFNYKITYRLIGEPTDNDPEPNDNFAQSVWFTEGQQVKGHIGYIAANAVTDGADFYKTIVTKNGMVRVYMETENTGNNTGLLYVTGFDQRQGNGQLFASTPAYYTAPGTRTVDSVDLYGRAAGDTFYFRVTRDFQCFNYKLSFKTFPPLEADDAEPNNQVAQAIPLAHRELKTGHIGYRLGSVVDSKDYYKTLLPYDGVIKVKVKGTNTGTGTGLLYVTAYDSKMSSIGSKTIAYYSAPGTVSVDSLYIHCRLADSAYFLVSHDFQSYTYQISYEMLSATNGLADREANNSFNTAQLLAAGDSIQGNIGYYSGTTSDDNDYFVIKPPHRGTLRVFLEATQTGGGGTGLLYLRGYNQQKQEVFYRNPAYYVPPGTTVTEQVNVYCTGTDSFYLRIHRDNNCFSYKLRYTITLGADTTVYTCSSCTADISNLYDVQPFSTVKYENVGAPGTPVDPKAVQAGTYMLSVISGTNECSRDTAYITVSSGQKINFDSIPNKIFGDAPFAVRAVSTAGLPVTYRIVSGPATVLADTVTLTGAGVVTIRAEQAGNATFNYAMAERTFTVEKATAGIVLSQLTKTYDGQPIAVQAATTPPSLPVTITYNGSSSAPVHGGRYLVTATVNAANYTGSVTDTAVIHAAGQQLTITKVGQKAFSWQPFAVQASASSGLPVTFSLTNTPDTVATLNGNMVGMLSLGRVIITASQDGNQNFVAAVPVSDTFEIVRGPQQINLPPLPDRTVGDTVLAGATATSLLPVGITITTVPAAGVATLKGDTILLNGTSGTVTVQYNQPGDYRFFPAQAQATFKVVGRPQTITFNPIPNKVLGDAPFVISASATSGLPVQFRLVSGPALLRGDTVTLTNDGVVTIEATQGGSQVFNTAPPVRQSFTVTRRYPDLFVHNVTTSATVLGPGDSTTVSWSEGNQGAVAALQNWTLKLYMQSPTGTNRVLLKQVNSNTTDSLRPSGIIHRSERITIPQTLNVGNTGVFAVELVPSSYIQDDPATVANNTGVQAGTWQVKQLLRCTLSSAQVTEGAGDATTATIYRTGALDNPLQVQVTNRLGTRLNIPASFTIPAQQATASFAFGAPDNNAIEGNLADTITVQATGFNQVEQPITIIDNDQPTLTISNLPARAMEGVTVTFRITTDLPVVQPLTVYLTSGSQPRFPLAASVVIPAGRQWADVVVPLEQDNIPELEATVSIMAAAANHHPANAAIVIEDDDVPGIELVLQTNAVSEAAGPFATKGILKRTGANTAAIKVNFSADRSNTLLLPASVSLAAGQQQVTFDIGTVDNTLNDGDRAVRITASIFFNSCGCNAPANTMGSTSAVLTVTDNDGPALVLTASELTLPEGKPQAGYLKIFRNTGTSGALTVALTSSDTMEARVPPTVVIPAGADFINIPITTVDDNVADGNKQVYLQAAAPGYSSGSVWIIVSDQNKPDLHIPFVKVPATVQALSVFNYQYTVKNGGFAAAPAGIKVRGYLSKDAVLDNGDSLLIDETITTAIAAGHEKQMLNAVRMPNIPGAHSILFKVNADLAVTELLTTNNLSQAAPVYIQPNYTATAVVERNYYLRGTAVPITGRATRADGSPATNEQIEVYIIVNGIRRTVLTSSDGAGNFSTLFTPMPNEAGHYTVGAAFPGLGKTDAQDSFDILGVKINGGNVPQYRVTIGEPLQGTLSVQNMSNTPLNNFALQPVTLPNCATMQFGTVSQLGANATINLPYTITGAAVSPGSNFETATFRVSSAEGDIQPATLYYYCQAPNAWLEASQSSLNVTTSQQAGDKLVEIRVVNKGKGATGNMSVTLPQLNWLSSVTPVTMPSLASGDTGVVVLRFSPLPEVPFNLPVNGSLSIKAQNSNAVNIPFTYTKVSDTSGQVKVIVTNQFTYYTDGAPKVSGAKVTIKNYYTGQVYVQGTTNSQGELLTGNLPEGTHRVIVEKEKHITYTGTVTIKPGSVVENVVFLNYQAITFNWSVTPTAIQDQYDITLETKFETHVPMPVVTIDMPKQMPQLSGTETYGFNVVLTNHGLITANDVTLGLPDGDPEYEFITNYTPGNLLAQQSIQVPVLMRRRQSPRGAAGRATLESIAHYLGIQPVKLRGANGGGCQDFTAVSYWYTCNTQTGLWQKGGSMFSYSGRQCAGGGHGGFGGIPIDVGGIPTSDDGGYNDVPCADCGPGNGIVIPNPFPPTEDQKKSCVQCINDGLGALNACTGVGGAAAGSLSCISGNMMDNKAWYEYAACVPLPIPPPVACALAVNNALATCAASGSSGRPGLAGRQQGSSLGAAFDKISNNLTMVEDALAARDSMARQYFGNMVTSDALVQFAPMVEHYIVYLDSIRPATQDSILNAMKGFEISQADIAAFFTRWNTSIAAHQAGIKEPNAQYPNIINWNKVRQYSHIMGTAVNHASTNGFASVQDMYQKEYAALTAFMDKQNNAVCASVTMQLSQRLTMTREAFRGTLEIFNGHPSQAMDSMTVSIHITDAQGVPKNHLFEMVTESVSNLGNITGTGSIPSQQKGNVQLLFIPENGAAPTAPVVYNFGGSVRYWDPYANGMVTMPLSPVPLTVHPSASLALHYFMQRNILGDDPLTTREVEPSLPAELGVMVENHGYGPAVNMTISSAQPKITDNEKGLAINFTLAGSQLQGQPKNMGVTDINFGTIPALKTRVGQWFFTSSLLGKFISYDAKVVHSNSFGNPELSLVKSVKLHELTRSIKAYAPGEDDINDFLVNDDFDAKDLPDLIYFSEGRRTAKVHQAASGSFSSLVLPPTFTNTLTVTASQTGWNYIQLNDPGQRRYELQSITRSDGQTIPLSNGWLTFVTLPLSQQPVYENKFHFVDTFATTQPVSYTVVWKPGSVDVLKVDTITGVPQQIATSPVETLTVKFTRQVDPATFTWHDLSLTLQGGANIASNAIVITQTDTATFTVDLSALTTGNGFYSFTVQAAEVADIYGINGQNGKRVTWTQMLNAPVVQAFQGIPESRVAAAYSTIRVLFNMPIDVQTVTPSTFIIQKDGVVLPGQVTIDSISADGKTFFLSGLQHIISTAGVYTLVVDLPNVVSQSGIRGEQQQSVDLTLDNAGPMLVLLQRNYNGGLDAQHVPFVQMQFNEVVHGFNTAACTLTRNGENIPLRFDQLTNTAANEWLAGNFGMATYPDGRYAFTINMTLVKDGLGNAGSGTQTIEWVVDRTTPILITNVQVSPDKGFSNTDGITADQQVTIQFDIDRDAAQVWLYQFDLSGQKLLATSTQVTAGAVSMAVTLPNTGNTGIRIVAVGAQGGQGTAEKQLVIDPVPLTAHFTFTQHQVVTSPVASISVAVNSRLLNDSVMVQALTLHRNGLLLKTPKVLVNRMTDTLFVIHALQHYNTAEGNYHLQLNLTRLAKYLSGKTGTQRVSAYWKVIAPNRAPVAHAGNDTLITRADTVRLNGTASYDPDNDSITYRWVAPAGITLKDSLLATPSFVVTPADDGKTFTFLLIVSDGKTFTTQWVNVTVQLQGGPLPVSWLFVRATQQGSDAVVSWATASETNARNYIVERSADGRNFTNAGMLPAKGNSTQVNQYSFADAGAITPQTTVLYYRLRQVDADGSYTHSAVVSLVVTQTAGASVLVKAYPNPFAGQLALQLVNVGQSQPADKVQLFSIHGKLLYTRPLAFSGNSTILLSDMPALRSGTYVLQVIVGGQPHNLVVQRQ